MPFINDLRDVQNKTRKDISQSQLIFDETIRRSGFSGASAQTQYDHIYDIIGILYEKDFHNYVAGTTKSIETIMKPAEFIPPTVKISELLKKFTLEK